MTIEVKLILAAIGLLVSLLLWGETVNDFLHGDNNWQHRIHNSQYFDYHQSQKENDQCPLQP